MKFYNEMPEMEFFSGDTLPVFTVEVEAESLENCSMAVVISREDSLETPILRKECTKTDGGFQVQITSNETLKLTEGAYRINFKMTDSSSLSYIKLSGLAYVRAGG